jgi:predicted metal-dependent peptidase
VSQLLAKAKAQLILDQPFFASLLLSMPMVEDSSIATLATNGEKILYNPSFLESLSLQETIFVLAHETMHCVFQHMHRRGSRNAKRWNVAADYVINEVLVKERVGTMPQGCLYDPNIVSQGKDTTEGVYDLLPQETEQDKAHGDGGALDEVQDAGQDAATMAQAEAEMRVRVVQAANAAKMAGKLPGSLARIVSDVTRSRVDWKSVLRRFLSERAKTDWSYARPKRRFLAEDMLLPSLTGERMGSIVVAIDCSGSVDERLLAEFATEVKAIIADIMPAATHVIYFDSEVLKADTYGTEDAIEIKPIGGGGTAFSPIFNYIEEHEIEPAACVVLTDLYCDDFGTIPDYPVLWASNGADHAPWGEIVRLERS